MGSSVAERGDVVDGLGRNFFSVEGLVSEGESEYRPARIALARDGLTIEVFKLRVPIALERIAEVARDGTSAEDAMHATLRLRTTGAKELKLRLPLAFAELFESRFEEVARPDLDVSALGTAAELSDSTSRETGSPDSALTDSGDGSQPAVDVEPIVRRRRRSRRTGASDPVGAPSADLSPTTGSVLRGYIYVAVAILVAFLGVIAFFGQVDAKRSGQQSRRSSQQEAIAKAQLAEVQDALAETQLELAETKASLTTAFNVARDMEEAVGEGVSAARAMTTCRDDYRYVLQSIMNRQRDVDEARIAAMSDGCRVADLAVADFVIPLG